MASSIVRLLDGLIDVSVTAKKKAVSWDRQYVKVVHWTKAKGRLPGAGDEKRLYNWWEAQQGRYEIGELNVLQSKRIARLLQTYGQGGPGLTRKRMKASIVGLM